MPYEYLALGVRRSKVLPSLLLLIDHNCICPIGDGSREIALQLELLRVCDKAQR